MLHSLLANAQSSSIEAIIRDKNCNSQIYVTYLAYIPREILRKKSWIITVLPIKMKFCSEIARQNS